MKKSVVTLPLIVFIFIAYTFVTGCTARPKQEQNQSDALKKDSTNAVVYACAMHPEVTGKEGDKCSKCGMQLEAVASSDSTAHPTH